MPTLNPPHAPAPWADAPLTARLVLADGTVIAGIGLGATGSAVGEVCFNTAMTGYQEILTDPSYAGQIITFTFPHIGNVGTNDEDIETSNLGARSGVRGCVLRDRRHRTVQLPRRRAARPWLKARGIIGHRRRRHPRADRAHPREGHAERRHRARAPRQVRHRQAEGRGQGLARPRRHGPRARRDERRRATPGTRRLGVGQGLRRARRIPSSTSSRSTTA